MDGEIGIGIEDGAGTAAAAGAAMNTGAVGKAGGSSVIEYTAGGTTETVSNR
jgi:hypothetical protein